MEFLDNIANKMLDGGAALGIALGIIGYGLLLSIAFVIIHHFESKTKRKKTIKKMINLYKNNP